MAKKPTSRTNVRTPEQIERDRQLRAKYQATRPSLADLQASSDYLPPVTQGELLEMMDFAMRIKARRQQLDLSLADLAAKTGIDKAALSRLENGQVENPTFSTLERIAKALNQRLRLVLEDEQTVAHGSRSSVHRLNGMGWPAGAYRPCPSRLSTSCRTPPISRPKLSSTSAATPCCPCWQAEQQPIYGCLSAELAL